MPINILQYKKSFPDLCLEDLLIIEKGFENTEINSDFQNYQENFLERLSEECSTTKDCNRALKSPTYALDEKKLNKMNSANLKMTYAKLSSNISAVRFCI